MTNSTNSNIRNLYITTNVSCNLNCIYCYEDKTSKEIFNLERTKENIKKYLSIKTDGGTILNLHGGEPFLIGKQIKELCNWLWEQRFPEKFTIFATSNGTLIHGELKDWLFKNKDRIIVGLSLDGTKEMHDLNRSNSFDLIDIDFFVKTWPKQGVKMTVSPLTIGQLSNGIIYLHSRGIHNILVNLAYMVDWSKCEFLDQYQSELLKLSEFYKKNPELPKDSIFDLNFILLGENKNIFKKWCGAGTQMKAHDIDGREYPCHLFFESVCGKEKSIKSKDIDFYDPNEYVSNECSECVFLAACPTCYGANYIERNCIANRDMNLCKLNKIRVFEIAKYEYDRIVNDSRNIESFSDNEKINRIKTLNAIENLIPHFDVI